MARSTRRLPTSTLGRHQIRRRRHCRGARTQAERRRHGCARARGGEVGLRRTARAACPADRSEVSLTRSLPTEGSPHVAAALRVAWRTLGRGRRADGGLARVWTSSSMISRILPFHHPGVLGVRDRPDFSRFDPRPERPHFSNFGPPAGRRPFCGERRPFCETAPAGGL